jgi:hypothetical protein
MPRRFSRTCDQCKNPYVGEGRRFCGLPCRNLFHRGKPRRITYRPRTCVECKKQYSPTNTTGKRCSPCSKVYTRFLIMKKASDWRKCHPNYNKERYWSDPEHWRNASLNRTHMKRANGGAGVSESEWTQIKALYNNRCVSCLRDDVKLTQDHKYPIALGGRHEPSNIQPLCLPCNARKGAKLISFIQIHDGPC